MHFLSQVIMKKIVLLFENTTMGISSGHSYALLTL
jgi:hypothetical protein